MDRTSAQPLVKVSFLLSNSFKVGPLAGHSTIGCSLRATVYSNLRLNHTFLLKRTGNMYDQITDCLIHNICVAPIYIEKSLVCTVLYCTELYIHTMLQICIELIKRDLNEKTLA
jgi:hypothetical protein